MRVCLYFTVLFRLVCHPEQGAFCFFTTTNVAKPMIKIKKGLDLPIQGEPIQIVQDDRIPKQVAILGDDYIGLRPTMLVREGDQVKKGQGLFTDKKNPRVLFTAPVAGTVSAINRGERRAFQSIVIDVDEQGEDFQTFPAYSTDKLATLDRETVENTLLESGFWTALRTRPYSKVAEPGTMPHAIFVTAVDTNPLACNPQSVIRFEPITFLRGLAILCHLTEGKVHVCHSSKTALPSPSGLNPDKIKYTRFEGPHPSGLVGTHIHFLEGVSLNKTVWHIGYQDVIAIGKLFTSGELDFSRVVALARTSVKRPRLIRTCIGASLDELVENELSNEDSRVISGSVLSGRISTGPYAFLGRYHTQISVLPEGHNRELLGWILPSPSKFSTTRTTLGHFLGSKIFASKSLSSWRKYLSFTTTKNGGDRCLMPIGGYEQVMPLDILATMLLRDLAAGDTDGAQDLGCLELDEEDLALCTFVCPGKHEYGSMLRDALTKIEKEG